jgi:hypothetical protein
MSETSSEDNSSTADSVRYYWRQLSSRAYLMAHVLGLKKLQDFMQVCTFDAFARASVVMSNPIQGSAALTAAPACLLGQFYGNIADMGQDASISDEVRRLTSRVSHLYRQCNVATLTSRPGPGSLAPGLQIEVVVHLPQGHTSHRYLPAQIPFHTHSHVHRSTEPQAPIHTCLHAVPISTHACKHVPACQNTTFDQATRRPLQAIPP